MTHIEKITNDIPPFILLFFLGLIPVASALSLAVTALIASIQGTTQEVEPTLFIALFALSGVLFTLSHKMNPTDGIQL